MMQLEKRTAVSIIIGLLVLAGVVVYASLYHVGPLPSPSSSTETQQKVQVGPMVQVADTKLPDKFPSDIPLEPSSTILANYNQVNAAGEYQASRNFVSAKTIQQNYDYYKTALPTLGWTLGFTTPNQNGSAFIFATKDNNSLNIRIYKDASNRIIVAISNIAK